MGLIPAKLAQRARALKAETFVLYYAARHPRTPWYAKLMAVLVVAYAFSPIDLIPDFVPILGYLDDIILVPLGIALTLRLVPPPVLAECRAQAEARLNKKKPRNWIVGGLIIAVWIGLAVLCVEWAREYFSSPHAPKPVAPSVRPDQQAVPAK